MSAVFRLSTPQKSNLIAILQKIPESSRRNLSSEMIFRGKALDESRFKVLMTIRLAKIQKGQSSKLTLTSAILCKLDFEPEVRLARNLQKN